MDSLSPEDIISITAGVIALFVGLILLVFHLQYPRHFAAYFGCKVASAPKLKKGRRSNPKIVTNSPLEFQRNPILILQDRKVQEDVASPLRVYRTRKEFTATPTKVVNGHVRTVLGRAPGDLRV